MLDGPGTALVRASPEKGSDPFEFRGSDPFSGHGRARILTQILHGLHAGGAFRQDAALHVNRPHQPPQCPQPDAKRQARYQAHTNHGISKAIVTTAQRTGRARYRRIC